MVIMGNVSGKKEEETGEGSGIKNQEHEEEEYMEYGLFPDSMVQSPPHTPKAYHYSPLVFTPQVFNKYVHLFQENQARVGNGKVAYILPPQTPLMGFHSVPIFPLQRPDGILIQNQSGNIVQKTMEHGDMPSENGIPTMIIWSHGGHEVAIEGSWDGWKTKDFLRRTDKDFTVMKVLPSGLYHYRFIVDGQWRYAPDFPFECDDTGNVFNVLDLQDIIPEVLNNTSWLEAPSSPQSSYSSAPFSSEDFNEKLPDLPPLLQQTPLDQPSSSAGSMDTFQKPLPAVLNHLYIQKSRSSQSMVALSSTHRFRTKYVTAVLYKSLKNLNK